MTAWTDELDATLRRLWKNGLSASQIAAKLDCGKTRNAVIGRVHRLNLSGRAKPDVRVPRVRKRSTKRTIEHKKKSKPLPKPDPLQFARPLNGVGVPFLDRRAFQCAWIIDGANNVCGHPVSHGIFKWCPHHCSIGLVKPIRPERKNIIDRHKTNEGAFR